MKNHSSFQQLESRLVLLAWLNSLLGYKSNRTVQEDRKAIFNWLEERKWIFR